MQLDQAHGGHKLNVSGNESADTKKDPHISRNKQVVLKEAQPGVMRAFQDGIEAVGPPPYVMEVSFQVWFKSVQRLRTSMRTDEWTNQLEQGPCRIYKAKKHKNLL